MRRLLVGLDSLPVLRLPGRLLYRADTWLAATLCRSMPELCAVYVTGSMAGGDIVPGLSDIDLVTVIRDLPVDREFQVIQRLEQRLRFTLPPFGMDKSGTHLLIYSLAEWRAVGDILLGKRLGRPSVLLDRCDTQPRRAVGNAVQVLHHLLKAWWRLETLQAGMNGAGVNGAGGDALDDLLRQRVAQRLLKALEAAHAEQQAPAADQGGELAALLAAIRGDLARSGPQGDAAASNLLLLRCLPDLLASFDRVLQARPSVPPAEDCSDTHAGPWSPEHQTADCANAEHSSELAKLLRTRLADRAECGSLWVSRVGAVDFLVCDPCQRELVRELAAAIPLPGARSARILSLAMLDKLYLNDEFGPCAFLRPGDLAGRVAVGALSGDRFLLEAYAMFPRVRALHKLGDPAVSDAYRTRMNRLLTCLGARETLTGDPPGECGAAGCFRSLREQSHELLESMQGPVPGVCLR